MFVNVNNELKINTDRIDWIIVNPQLENTSYTVCVNTRLFSLTQEEYSCLGIDPEEPTFIKNKTIYLNCASSGWDESSATFKIIFYNNSNEKLNESYMSSTKTSHVFSLQIPVDNAVKIKIERWSNDKSAYWGTSIELTADTAGTNDCAYCTAYAVAEWRTQGSGHIVTGGK